MSPGDPPGEQSQRDTDEPVRSRRTQAIAVGAVIVVVAATAGFLLGRRDGEARAESKQEDTQQIRSGAFAFEAPKSWREPGRPSDIPGLALADRIELAPSADGAEGTLIVGVAPADDGSLLPATLVPHPRPSGAARLADLQALRYDGLRPLDAAGPIDVYAVPIANGALTAVCTGADPGFLGRCREAVGTLRLTRGESYPLGPDRVLRDELDGVMRDLNRTRERQAAAMKRARRPEAQAAAANAIAGAYVEAAGRVERASQNPASAEARSWLAFALGKAETAWRRLAGVAGAGNAEAYPLARAVVMFSERSAGVAAAHATRSATESPSPSESRPSGPVPPPQAAVSTPCSDTHTAYGAVPDDWKGFARICANADGTSVVVENISNVVLVVEHDGRPTDVTDPPDSLSGVVTAEFARGACLGASCRLYPGTSVRIDADAPVDVDFALAFNDTVTVGLAGLFADRMQARFTARPLRRARQILDCASGVVSTYDGGTSWEEVLREAAPTASGCTAIASEFRRTPAPERRAAEPRPMTPPENITITKNPTFVKNPALAKRITPANAPMLTRSVTVADEAVKLWSVDAALGIKFLRALPRFP